MADMPEFNAKLWSQNLSAVLDRNRDMAACRKLKQDMEQTLKKVADGILLFNEFNKKMEESQNVKDRDKAMMKMLQSHVSPLLETPVMVEPNDLGNLKDSMEHYLQDAAEPDFVEDTLMYESLPLGEVNSRVGHIAKHEKDKKNADGTDQEQEDSEDEELMTPGGERSAAKQARAGDHRRAIPLPKPLVSDQLLSLQNSPDAGDLEDTLQEDSSTPNRMLEHYPSDLESSLAEPLQGFGSFSLPPGLYAPEAPNTIGAQATIQTQQPFLDQLQTQSSPFTQVNESPFNPVTQPSAVSNATQYTGSSDAQYFQTAQMKLHAREQRLQLERAKQQSAAQQQQPMQMQMQLQLQLLQQQQPPPPPRTSPFEPQLQAQLQQPAQAAATPMPVQQWSVQPQLPPQEKLASSRDFQTPLFDQEHRCTRKGCQRLATFNHKRRKQGILCKQHAAIGMVSKKPQSCLQPGCNRRPCYSFKGEEDGFFCYAHQREGMVKIGKRRPSSRARPAACGEVPKETVQGTRSSPGQAAYPCSQAAGQGTNSARVLLPSIQQRSEWTANEDYLEIAFEQFCSDDMSWVDDVLSND